MKNYQNRGVDDVKKDRQLQAPLVTKYMTKNLITFKPDTPVQDVITSLLKNRITGAPVLSEQGNVIGVIDDKDCLNVLVGSAYYNHPVEKETVARYMSDNFKSITIHDKITDAAGIFINSAYKRLLVMDDDERLAGQISRRDILRAIHDLNTNTW